MYDDVLQMLVRRGIVTTDESEAAECCGLERDDDGFCSHRPGHPIYVPMVRRVGVTPDTYLTELADDYEAHARELSRSEQRIVSWGEVCDWLRARAAAEVPE